MTEKQCVYCKKPLPKNPCNLTYLFDGNFKDLAFCSSDCRGNFIEFARDLKEQINAQFNNNLQGCKKS
jgi:hypothetical protein